MICSICEKDTECPYETPADPPFYPAEGGWHCQACEDWLSLPAWRDIVEDDK